MPGRSEGDIALKCTTKYIPPTAPTNSVRFQWLCPGDPLQIEVKEHINANIMA